MNNASKRLTHTLWEAEYTIEEISAIQAAIELAVHMVGEGKVENLQASRVAAILRKYTIQDDDTQLAQ